MEQGGADCRWPGDAWQADCKHDRWDPSCWFALAPSFLGRTCKHCHPASTTHHHTTPPTPTLQGYFLLRESMLDSVLVARDRFLKPGGALYPSHARMVLAPIRSNQCRQRQGDFQNSMEGWAEFLGEMKRYYNVDLDCLSGGGVFVGGWGGID